MELSKILQHTKIDGKVESQAALAATHRIGSDLNLGAELN